VLRDCEEGKLQASEVTGLDPAGGGADAIHAALFEKIIDDFPVGRISSDEGDALYRCGSIRHEMGG